MGIVETLTPEEAANHLKKVSAERIRAGLRQDKFPFGTAVQGETGQWTYLIIKSKFFEYIGYEEVN